MFTAGTDDRAGRLVIIELKYSRSLPLAYAPLHDALVYAGVVALAASTLE